MPDSDFRSPQPALKTRSEVPLDCDAIVIGAGFGGLYMLHSLRKLGLTVKIFERGGDVGGTWYWNRYPGARCDIESLQYSFQFDAGLQQDWSWSEKYAPQAEILNYANHVADRFDLRRDITFEATVETASWDEDHQLWQITVVSHGTARTLKCRYFVTAVGCLSAANTPDIPGLADFPGPVYHTGDWPHEEVDFTGKRVAVIGTGSSAIQSIPVIAELASHLTVFQRTPNYAVPAWNAPMDREREARIKADYKGFRDKAKTRPTGVWFEFNTDSPLEMSEADRNARYEEHWQRGGLPFMGSFGDLLTNPEANETAADFVRAKIADIVTDPETARLLSPDNVLGCKRLCVDTGYYATFNRDNVSLVDVSETPIEKVTGAGPIVDGVEYPVDAVVCATGFAAMTGSFEKIRITGRDGLTLKSKWEAGPRTLLGVMTAGFPNMFMVTGPGSPSVLANVIVAIEQNVEYIADSIAFMEREGLNWMDPEVEAEDAWVEEVNRAAGGSLRSTCSSWYLGANIPGRPRVFMPYIGGYPVYAARCDEIAANGYQGFKRG